MNPGRHDILQTRGRVWLLFTAGLLLLFFGETGPTCLHAQESESVWISNITGTAVGRDLPPEEGRQKAKTQAYVLALRRRGIDFSADYLLRQSEAGQSPEKLRRANDGFLVLFRSRAQGFVTGTRNASWQTRTTEQGTEYRVTLDARITRPRGSVDHGFFIRLVPAAATVRPGEGIRLRVSPSRESLLYVYHITRDGVRLLYPDSAARDLAVRADSTVEIPPRTGEPWQADLPEEWESSEELILAIATKTKHEAGEAEVVDREGYRSAREGALIELLEWLAGMPVGETADASLRIDVVRN
jgi:Domain of unknown function (DUF4384)